MHRRLLPAMFGICVLMLGSVLAQAPADRGADGVLPQPVTALVHANVLDVRTGRIAQDATIVLRGGKIESIGVGAAPTGALVFDLAGRYALPGLIDAHTHLDDLAAARRALESGVTTVRSASVGSFRDVSLRELSKKGIIAGPDMVAAGIFVTPNVGDDVLADPSLGNLVTGVTTSEKLRQLVRANLAHGVDVIKTRGTERAGTPDTDPRQQVYSEAELRVIVEEAATKGIPVEAHAHGDEGAMAAVKAGVRSIEHGTFLSDATLSLMKERGTFLDPTYSTLIDLLEPGGDYEGAIVHMRARHMLPRMKDTIQRASKMGVRIVTGADTSYGPASVTRISQEVSNLVEAGLSPLEAIQSATIVAADCLLLAKATGVLDVGFDADVIAVEKNPLEAVTGLQDVLLVISNGRVALNRLTFAKP
jgi:imidazolonepropionase-like amidohydrolase